MFECFCSFILILLCLNPKLSSGLDPSKPTRHKIVAVVRQAEQSLREHDPEAASEHYQQALSVLHSEDDYISAASIHFALGRIRENDEQFQQSLWHYERGIQILAAHRSAGMASVALDALRRMDKGYMESPGAPLSIDLYPGEIPELSLFLSKPDVPLLTTALLMNAGNMYLRQSQFRQADSLYLKALNHLNPAQERRLKWQLQANLAWSALKSDRIGAADVWLDSVMTELPEQTTSLDVRRAFLAAGVSLRERGEYASSIRKLTYAIRLYERAHDSSGLGRALAHLGTAHFMAGEPEKARQSYQQALAMNDDSETEWHANGGLARYYHRIGDLTAASRHYRLYVAVVNRIGQRFSTDQGKVSLLENHKQVFEDYARVELKLAQRIGDYGAARKAIEQLRDQTLLSLLEMNRYRRRLHSGHLDALKFIDSHSARDPDLQSAGGIFNPDLPPSNDIRQMAPYIPSVVTNDAPELTSPVDYIEEESDFDSSRIPPATFLEYFVLSDQLVILVKSTTGEVHGAVISIDEASLFSAVTEFGRALGLHGTDAVPLLRNVLPKGEEARTGSPVSLIQLSRQLYEWLIWPVIACLPEENNSQLILVPHVNLWQLPFAALQDERGRFLCDRFLLSYAPSASVWKWMAAQRRASDHRNPRAWIVGNPRMPQTVEGCGFTFEFTPLRGSQKEAEAVARLFGQNRSELFIGEKADRLRLEAWHPDFSVLHLATHGFSCTQDPLRSFVILTALGSEEMALDVKSGVVHARGDDRFPVTLEGYQDRQLPVMLPYPGVLDAWTIIDQYHLNADLVTLSACQTGLGKFLSQGAIGFSRAFLKAGARSLLVSQWNVNDAATAELMIAFYREYLKHGHKALALQIAMKECRKHHPHPRDWAAFTLVGLAE